MAAAPAAVLTQRHVGVPLVLAVQEAHALVARGPPVGQEALHDGGVLEQHVVHVAVGLAVQRHGAGLALGADASRPRRVLGTACGPRNYMCAHVLLTACLITIKLKTLSPYYSATFSLVCLF